MVKLPDSLISFLKSALPNPLGTAHPLIEYLENIPAGSSPSGNSTGIASTDTATRVDAVFLDSPIYGSVKGGYTLPPELLTILDGLPDGAKVLVNLLELGAVNETPGIIGKGDTPIVFPAIQEIVWFGVKSPGYYHSYDLTNSRITTYSSEETWKMEHGKNLIRLWSEIHSVFSPALTSIAGIQSTFPTVKEVTDILPLGTGTTRLTVPNIYKVWGQAQVFVDGLLKYSKLPDEVTTNLVLDVPDEVVAGATKVEIYAIMSTP